MPYSEGLLEEEVERKDCLEAEEGIEFSIYSITSNVTREESLKTR